MGQLDDDYRPGHRETENGRDDPASFHSCGTERLIKCEIGEHQ